GSPVPVAMLDGCFFAQTTGPMAFGTAAKAIGRDGAERLFSEPPEVPPDDEYLMDNVPTPDDGVSLILLETFEERGG
ncbi:MAG: hypothetical protein ACU836_19045, partial [Gammaproteobacteria bacterium]